VTISTDQIEASGLRFDVTDAVATVTLNRPERRNAMTPAVWRALAAIGSGLPPRVRVLVVRGAGPSFSSGIDLRMFSADGVPGEESLAGAADPDVEAGIAAYQEGFLWLRDPGIVSIAAVQGHAIGAGFQLALAAS
jgi:enoyl-CoA hydratase/carnithine racemase